jgi:hypothetical protein
MKKILTLIILISLYLMNFNLFQNSIPSYLKSLIKYNKLIENPIGSLPIIQTLI